VYNRDVPIVVRIYSGSFLRNIVTAILDRKARSKKTLYAAK